MIGDIEYWNSWEKEFRRREPVNVARNFRLMDELYQEARQLGSFTLLNPMDGLETDILYAKAINASNTITLGQAND